MNLEAAPTPHFRSRSWLGWLALAPALLLALPAFGQDDEEEAPPPVDPCSVNPCRELTRDERAAFGRLLSKMMDAMPVPDRLSYQQSALKSVQGLGQSFITDEQRHNSVFPANIVDPMALAYTTGTFPRSLSVAFLFVRKDGGQGGERVHKVGSGELEIFDLRIQVTGFAVPVVADVLASGRKLESKGAVAMWERTLPAEEKGMALVSVLVGQRTEDREATVGSGAQPPDALASLHAVQVDIHGPKNEVQAIAKKVDTKALSALIAPSARKPAAARKKGAK